MRVSHLFCDGCGKEVIDDGKTSIYVIALSERTPCQSGSRQFLVGPDSNPGIPELCDDCGTLIKTLLQNKSLQKVLNAKP